MNNRKTAACAAGNRPAGTRGFRKRQGPRL